MSKNLAEARPQSALVDKERDRKSLADRFRDLRELCESEGYTLKIPSRSNKTAAN